MDKRTTASGAMALVLFVVCTVHGVCQDSTTAGRLGISASLQSSQVDILLPLRVGASFSVAPALGFLWAENGGSDIRLGVVPRYYFRHDNVQPFVDARIDALINVPESGSRTTDWLVGVGGGGEYYLDAHFSLGVEAQLNLSISDANSPRFGDPGKKTLNTAASVFASFYF